MHCKKNIYENILSEKDKSQTRIDMQLCHIQQHLSLQPAGTNGDKYFVPNAPFVLSKDDKKVYWDNLRTIKFPTTYVSNFHKQIANQQFKVLKSHDYHILMQQVLPIFLKGIVDAHIVGTITCLCRVFWRLLAKVVHTNTKEQLIVDVAEVISCMEKTFHQVFSILWSI